ncbi:alpha beta-hydrolase [Mycena metata]|uniref:Alpha beta-hydrolase n=1 Tax=Mycena metata TaxID=1033252 RepID=A0AAD7NGT0_9AGAR|nr:alpha beta-hydrolase [Mycena metata]
MHVPHLTFSERLAMNLTLLRLPFFLIYVSLLGHHYSKRANGRPLNRILNGETAYFVLSHLSIRQLQAVSGSSLVGYAKWGKGRKIKQGVDELSVEGDSDSHARIMWVGPRETEFVVIYCHGGGFVGPLSDFQVEFWYRMQQALLARNKLNLGVAILQYSTYPAPFPTQLNQLLSAIQHIMSTGLVGYILHPSPLVALSPSPSELSGFAGMCLISPWSMPIDIHTEDDSFDLVPSECLGLWIDTYLSTMPASHHVYAQPDTVPSAGGWFAGLNTITRRILITAGRNEVLYSSFVRLSEAMDACVKLDVQTGGVHYDAMFDKYWHEVKGAAPG